MVTEELYSRKLREIEHIYRVEFTRKQRDLWYARLCKWDEEVFCLACERFITTVEQRWQVRDGNLVAMLGTLSKTDAREVAAKRQMELFEHRMAEAEKTAEPMTVQIKEALRKALGRLGLW